MHNGFLWFLIGALLVVTLAGCSTTRRSAAVIEPSWSYMDPASGSSPMTGVQR